MRPTEIRFKTSGLISNLKRSEKLVVVNNAFNTLKKNSPHIQNKHSVLKCSQKIGVGRNSEAEIHF